MEVSARVGLAIVHLYSCGNVSTLWQVDPLPEVERSAGRVWPKLWDCSWFFLRQSIPDLTLLILILKTYWKCRAAEYDPETTTSPWKGIEIWCRIPIELCCLAQLCRVCNCMGNFSCTAPYMILFIWWQLYSIAILTSIMYGAVHHTWYLSMEHYCPEDKTLVCAKWCNELLYVHIMMVSTRVLVFMVWARRWVTNDHLPSSI